MLIKKGQHELDELLLQSSGLVNKVDHMAEEQEIKNLLRHEQEVEKDAYGENLEKVIF